ncbi:MAG TPA: hypothetical protein VFM54_20080, partial [Micromonosporaceae bacterium]|nr:hypothetical protein [Micromonosporaceae bacterium]
MTKAWRMRYTADTLARLTAEAEAEAELYRTGAKLRYWASPKMIALHGRDPWPAEDAAKEAYDYAMLCIRVNQELPSGRLYQHYARK